MTNHELRCQHVQAEITEAFLARRTADADDLAHAEGCTACSAHREDLAILHRELSAEPPPRLRDEVLRSVHAQAVAELRRERQRIATPLPAGFRQELVRILGRAAAAFPVVLVWNLAVLYLGRALLTPFVPAPLVSVLAVAYLIAATGWLTLIYGSIPFVAHGQVQRRLREAHP